MKLKLLSVLFFSSIILSACSNPFDQLADELNNLIAGDNESTEEEASTEETTDTATEEETSPESADSTTETEEEEVETIDYSHLLNQGEEVTLDAGTHDVGSDITPGRYLITAASGYGNIFVRDEEEYSVIGETLAGESDGRDDRPTQLVSFLDEGYSVEISTLESVTFTPYETTATTEIFPGQWLVGEDFPAGVYDVSLEDSEAYGSLEVSSHPEHNKSRHSLGSDRYGGMTEFTMSFEEGDIVKLSYIPKVTLTER